MNVETKFIKENHEHLDVRIRDFAFVSYIEKTTPEIMALSTFELLYLLKMIRKERNDMYHYMHLFKRAVKEGMTEFNEVE